MSPTPVPAPVPAECSQPRAHGGQPLRALKRHGSGGSALSDEGDGRLRGQSDVSWRMLWGGGTPGALCRTNHNPHTSRHAAFPRGCSWEATLHPDASRHVSKTRDINGSTFRFAHTATVHYVVKDMSFQA